MKWLIGILGLVIALILGVIAMTYPQPFLKARDAVGTRYVANIYPAGGRQDAAITYYELTAPASDKPTIVMFASLGREASDFNELAIALNADGYPILMIEAPLLGSSRPSQESPTLFDLARDAHAVYAQRGPVVLLGHAFGNRLARASATLFDAQTSGVVLIASGGQKPLADKAAKALRQSFDPRATIGTRRAAVRYAFFADENDVPDYWLRGWHWRTAQVQIGATQSTPNAEWGAGGTSPMLVIAAMQDTIAPPEDTIDVLEQAYPDRVTGVRLAPAGHALLPEQPDKIASAILAWLNTLSDEGDGE